MAAASRFKDHFSPPIKRLGVKKELTIITCMDSRVMPEQIFDLKLGDAGQLSNYFLLANVHQTAQQRVLSAEYIRNAGGRVTEDVIRQGSLGLLLLALGSSWLTA